MKNYKKILLIGSLLLLVITSLAFARSAADPESAGNKMQKKYCDSPWLLKPKEGDKISSRWEEEFKMFTEKDDRPNYMAMRSQLADLITLPNSLVKNCTNLQFYLTALAHYLSSQSANKDNSDNFREIGNYIATHQLAEQKDESTEPSVNIQNEAEQIEAFPATIDFNHMTANDSKKYSWTICNEGIDRTVRVVYAIEGALYIGTPRNAYRSDNGGKTFVAINQGLTNHEINVFYYYDGVLYAGTGVGGIFKSENHGTSWEPINNGLTEKTVYSLTALDGILLAGTYNGIFKSSYRSNHWKKASTGIAGFDPMTSSFNRIETLLTSDKVIIAGSGSGVFISKDQGENWTNHKIRYDSIGVLCLLNGAIYIGTDSGVQKSEDNGKNWLKLNSNLKLDINSLHAINGVLFAGNYSRGVFRSDDGGVHWFAINDGLIKNDVGSYAIRSLTSIDKTLFVGTNNGLFKLEID